MPDSSMMPEPVPLVLSSLHWDYFSDNLTMWLPEQPFPPAAQ